MNCLRRAPRASSAAEPIAQSRRVKLTISTIRAIPSPSSPISQPCVPSNSTSRGCVAAIAELVLEAHDRKRIARSVGEHARHQETRKPAAACASTKNASLIGALQNHLCPVSRYSQPAPARPAGTARVSVGAHVGAALLLGHAHAAERRGFLRDRNQPRIVLAAQRAARATRARAPAARARPAPRRTSSRSDSRDPIRPAPKRRTSRRGARADAAARSCHGAP